MKTRAPFAQVSLAALLLLSAGLCGCGLLRKTVEAPGNLAEAALGKDGKKQVDPAAMQVRFMRFADVFATEMTYATREFAERTNSPEGRVQALTWKIDHTGAMWRLASGPRPFAGVFDGIVMITFLRHMHEERWMVQWGEADRPMLEAFVRLEEGVWALAGEALSPTHLEQIRGIVDKWLAGDPTKRIAEVAKLPGFADIAGEDKSAKQGEQSSLVGEITGLMSLDPLSGLQPAVREFEQTRQLAERALYYLQRMPELVASRAELMVQNTGQEPEVQGALESVQRVSEAAASIAATAEKLPESFAAEREAALAQISTELTAQREGLVRDLETARAPLAELLEKTRDTAMALDQMSASVAQGANALDAFVGRFDKGEGQEGGAGGSANGDGEEGGGGGSGGGGNGEEGGGGGGFDITEYGDSAERIGIAVRELGATITTLDNSLPKVRHEIEEVGNRVDRSVDHLFARALQLLAAALAGVTLTILLVRWLSPRARAERPAER